MVSGGRGRGAVGGSRRPVPLPTALLLVGEASVAADGQRRRDVTGVTDRVLSMALMAWEPARMREGEMGGRGVKVG